MVGMLCCSNFSAQRRRSYLQKFKKDDRSCRNESVLLLAKEYSFFDDIPAERRSAIIKRRAKAEEEKCKDREGQSSEEEDEPNYKAVGESKMEYTVPFDDIRKRRRAIDKKKAKAEEEKCKDREGSKSKMEYSLFNDIPAERRRAIDQKRAKAEEEKCKDREGPNSEEEDEPEYKTVGESKMAKADYLSTEIISAERTSSTIARKFKEEGNRSSEEDEPSKTVIQKLPHIILNNIPSDTSDSMQDNVSTSEGKGSKPGSGSQESSGMLRPVIFFDYEIHEATNNLNDLSKIGEGGHGSVYKGDIDDTDVAIKILSNTGYQGIKEFHRQIGALGLARHANLVNLIGTCFQLRALVYEYVHNGSLEDCLKKKPAELTWQIRTRIVYEICTTLRFLHANLPDPLVHGDLKPHNVLLSVNFKMKLADFGLYRFLSQGEKSHMMKTFDGSTDYIDPDFLESGIVRPAIDVYSFGKTIIRILTGAQPTDEIYSTVHEARKTKSLVAIVDPAARGWPEKIVSLLARFALKCRTNKRNNPEFLSQFPTQLKMVSGNIVA